MNSGSLYKYFWSFLILLSSIIGYSQDNIVELTGKVKNTKAEISNILIINLNSKESTITNVKGEFSIEVKLKDTIKFSAIHYRPKEIIITDTILNKKIIVVNLEEKIINLEEVKIRPHNLTGRAAIDIKTFETQPIITPSSLGLPEANIKVKTKNERLLFEADDGKLIKFYGVAATINVTKLLNKISGRTKMLKDHVQLDKHIKIENEIAKLFSKKVLSEELGIPTTYVENFLDFCVNQKDFPEYSETVNALKILEYLKNKSQVYKKINKLN